MLQIKRYQNTRKYYDTEKCHYIAFSDFVEMVRDGVEFQVIDNRSGADVTAETLFGVLVDFARADAGKIPVPKLRLILRYSSLPAFITDTAFRHRGVSAYVFEPEPKGSCK